MAVIAALSIVIAADANPEHIAACVGTLRRNAPAGTTVEVLLVGPRACAAAAFTQAPVRSLEHQALGLAQLWGAGAEAARGDLLLFVPPATVPLEDLLVRHLAAHQGGNPRVVVGSIAPAPGAHPLARVGFEPRADGEDHVLADGVGCTISLSAALFRRIGELSPGLRWGAEVELLHRARHLGAELHWLTAPVGHDALRATAAEVVRARYEAGQGSVELYRHSPPLLPDLELGGFHARTPPAPSLRRMLLRLGGPPIPRRLGALLPSRRYRERWLRFLHDYHFWRGVRHCRGSDALWRAMARPPVILMYHAIGDEGERPGCYVVPRDRFRRQMRWLARRGYRVIGLEELLEHRRNQRPVPPRSVVITFDDGYADNHSLALPLLRRHRFPATFFLVSRAIGDQNRWDVAGELAGRAMLTWEQASELLASGMEIGAHTRRHPVLPELSPDQTADEIAGAREDLEAALGRPVRTFAYPFGRLDESTTAAVRAAGYDGACCSRSGVNDPAVPSLLLRRVEVRGTDSLARFALAVHRGWMARRRR